MYSYVLEGDLYHLRDEKGSLIGAPIEEVAICFSNDGDMMTLHKHGSFELVDKWVNKTREAYRNAGIADLANEMTVITGKFDLEQLNRVLDTSGYISRFLDFHGIELEEPQRMSL